MTSRHTPKATRPVQMWMNPRPTESTTAPNISIAFAEETVGSGLGV